MHGKPVDTIVITSDTFDRVPKDRCFIVYISFIIHGLGCFLPWNLLFHSYEYFICCKFLGDDSDIYRQHFLSFCALAAILAALVTTGIGLFIGFHGDTKRRIVPSIVVLIIMFILQVLFAVFDARDSSGVFLCVTILNIVVIGAFIGLYLSSISGIVSYFPDRYVNAVVIGTSFGILIAICSRVAFKYYSNDARVIAIYFLVSAIITLLVCFDTYFAFPYSRLFRFYHTSIKIDLLHTTKGRLFQVPYGSVLKQIWIQCISIFLHYFSTVTLFPSILSQVQSAAPTFLLPNSNDARVIAIYFLVSAIITLLVCFDTYFAFPYSRLFRFYHTSIKIDLLHTTKGRLFQVPYGSVLKQIWIQCISIFLHYFSTVTLFPSILSQVQSAAPTFLLPNLQFIDAVVLINFGIFNLLGNFFAGCVKKPYSRWILFFVFVRAIAVLFTFLFINFEPYSRNNLPVLIHDDHIFMGLVMFFAFTHGYFNSMLQMLTTKSVEPYLSATSAVVLQLFIFAGCFCGIIGSFVYQFLATLL
ncbi:unnamed protein product [Adineta steineri]|uniref:Equilibrative nucleoside transporter 1 n=1 Tax=Adineta steineri TaxID=433720 RepID=A0A813N4M6_9BILA|nr:unnamed protein product [Adineta steineri]